MFNIQLNSAFPYYKAVGIFNISNNAVSGNLMVDNKDVAAVYYIVVCAAVQQKIIGYIIPRKKR